MKLMSFAWHKQEMQWVKIIGMRDMTAPFDPDGVYFTYRHFTILEECLATSRGNLISMTRCGGLRLDGGAVENIESFNWTRHIKCPPVLLKDMPVQAPIEVGDHVTLFNYAGVAARVTEKYINTSGELMYKAQYYRQTNSDGAIEHPKDFRIPYGENNQLTLSRAEMDKLDTPAPRIQINPEKFRKFKFNALIKMQSGNYQGAVRWQNLTVRWQNLTVRSERIKLKQNGGVIARFVAESRKGSTDYLSDNVQAILDIFEDMEDHKAQKIVRNAIDDCYGVEDYIRICDQCGAIEETDSFDYSNWADVRFCRSCEDEFCWSEVMEDRIPRREAVSLYDDASAYNERDSNDSATRSWVEDSYNYEMYNACGVSIDCIEEIRDSDDSIDTGLMDYHRTDRIWRETWANKSYVPLGVELEVYAGPRKPAVIAVENALPGQVYLERDGSLSANYGFEVITQPFGKTEWATVGNTLLKTLKGKGAVAWSSPAGKGYGIHVNINREYLSSLQEARMFMFLVAEENVNFCRAIAQRCKMYNEDSGLGLGKTGKHRQNIRNMGGLDVSYAGYDENGESKYRKVMAGKGKYCPAYFHDGRMEIRMFQSTLNTVSFFKNLEFVWALVEWTSTKAATGTSWLYQDFLKWLVKRSHAEQDFPNLMAYLRRGTYIMKDGDDNNPHEISSGWQNLIPKPVRSSVAGEVVDEVNSETTLDDVVVVVPKYARSIPTMSKTMALAA